MILPRRSALVLAAAVAASAPSACAYNEALGRNQLLLVDNAALSQQSTAAWREAIVKPGVMTTGAQVDRIRRHRPQCHARLVGHGHAPAPGDDDL